MPGHRGVRIHPDRIARSDWYLSFVEDRNGTDFSTGPYRCPEDAGQWSRAQDEYHDYKRYHLRDPSYAVNGGSYYNGGRCPGPYKAFPSDTGRYTNPSRLIWMVDGQNKAVKAYRPYGADGPGGNNYNCVTARHGGGRVQNILHGDGHVESWGKRLPTRKSGMWDPELGDGQYVEGGIDSHLW